MWQNNQELPSLPPFFSLSLILEPTRIPLFLSVWSHPTFYFPFFNPFDALSAFFFNLSSQLPGLAYSFSMIESSLFEGNLPVEALARSKAGAWEAGNKGSLQ